MKKSELWQLIVVHFKELLREPGVLFWGIGFPILMAWGLGIAFTGEKETKKDIAVINFSEDRKLASFLDEHAVKNSDGTYMFTVNDPVFGRNLLRFVPLDSLDATLGVKRGIYQLMIDNRADCTVFYLDPANPEARLLQLQISTLLGERHDDDTFSGGNIIPLDVKGTRYIDFLVPGLIAMNIMMACMWGMSWTIIERRKGNMLRRMIVTPVNRQNILLGLMTARITMNFVEALLLILFSWLYFDIEIQGSIAALAMVFFAGNFAFTGIAILTSSRTSNSEVGNGIINFVNMPMMILSGIFFSYHNFPEWSLPVIQNLPLTLLADSMRSIINEGAGVTAVLNKTIIMSIIGVVTFGLGLKIFKWY
ncbi:MAG TPA: ABC transporter permease [Bacteroidales bacterium]|nr:ABC transporter permease [Bacteroidales bacterium]